MVSKEVDQGKGCAILAYLFPIGLIWFLVDEKMRKNSFAKFHVQQSLAATVAVIVGCVASTLLMIILIGFVLYWVTTIIGLIWFIQGIINAINGNKNKLWLIGDFGDKFNF